MNLVEAYIKLNGSLLFFVSGLFGCGKLALGKHIARDFKLKLIDQIDYYKKDYNTNITLPDNTVVTNWYTDDAIKWDEFNEDINVFKKQGLIVVGFSFPQEKINSKPDYHIHLNISKQLCNERRKIFLENNKEKYKEEYDLIGSSLEKIKMNQLIYPYYLESTKKARVNKFITVTDMNDDIIYDIAFDSLIKFLKKSLRQEDTQIETSNTSSPILTPKVTDVTVITDSTHSPKNTTSSVDSEVKESLSATMELMDPSDYTYDDELDMISKYSDIDEDDDEDSVNGRIKFVKWN